MTTTYCYICMIPVEYTQNLDVNEWVHISLRRPDGTGVVYKHEAVPFTGQLPTRLSDVCSCGQFMIRASDRNITNTSCMAHSMRRDLWHKRANAISDALNGYAASGTLYRPYLPLTTDVWQVECVMDLDAAQDVLDAMVVTRG